VTTVDASSWRRSFTQHQPGAGSTPIRFFTTVNSIEWLPDRGARPPALEDVPDQIREAAQEAYRRNSINAHRAAVLLARSVIEATAKAKQVVGASLVQKIDTMFDQRLIREHIKEGAHEIRFLGNEMAPGDFVNPAEAEDADFVLIWGETIATAARTSASHRVHNWQLTSVEGQARAIRPTGANPHTVPGSLRLYQEFPRARRSVDGGGAR
jgi:hypothetical protein